MTPEGTERLLTETLGIAAFGGIAAVPANVANQINKKQNQRQKLEAFEKSGLGVKKEDIKIDTGIQPATPIQKKYEAEVSAEAVPTPETVNKAFQEYYDKNIAPVESTLGGVSAPQTGETTEKVQTPAGTETKALDVNFDEENDIPEERVAEAEQD